MAFEEEELLLRQMPHSVEAEQAVLGEEMPDPAQDALQENE